MLCFLCGKDIGWLRSMVDRQYCCAEHRKEARLASAQVMREEEDDEKELWSVSRNRSKRGGSSAQSSNQASIVAFLTLAALLVAMLMLPGNNGGAPAGSAFPPVSAAPGTRIGLFARAENALSGVVREHAPITLHHDFREGLRDWTTVALSNPKVDDPRDWKIPTAPSVVGPGTLRIWNQSTKLQNYQLEFQAQIERHSLSWAFRAANPSNYYAAKIQITRPGPQPNADLVRYVMLNGQEMDRVQLPLPLTLERGGNYRVRVAVQDDRFVTYLNGQVVSSWSDKRLTRGGVGFFSDNDDEQRISWVNLSERDSFMGRMLAHFSFFVVPGQPLP
ncbi:MAG: hypothetical protein ABL967_18595 [Bryobacteraceae bacterium]